MRQRVLIGVGSVVVAVGLFLAYLRMARAFPINGDGASNALQAWDMFHGNPLLKGWALSDVSFYPTELVQYGIVQWFTGVTADQIHVTAAITYTIIVFLAAALAKGKSAGLEAWLRIGVAVAILLLPVPGTGYQTLLSSPNHTGSAVPLLLAWLVLDRLRHRVWTPVLIAVLLGWGAMGDPLITFVAAVPLAVVCLYRALRGDRVFELSLAGAAVVSVVISRGFRHVLDALGAFESPHPPIELAPVADWPHRAWMTARMVGVIFGTHRPGWHPFALELFLSALHFIGFAVALAAFFVCLVRAVRGTADRTDSVIIAAITCNLGAEIVSTISVDLMAAREIAPVLPMAAALAARFAGPWLASSMRGVRVGRGVLIGVLAVFALTVVVYSPPRAEPSEAQEAADYLRQRGLSYGLGAYWASNNITVTTENRVVVAPVTGGGDGLVPFCWQSKTEQYDAAAHDARFVVFEKDRPFYGTPEQAAHMWGAPVERHDVGKYAILLYDINLLQGFPPHCG
ncbi:hypothetical protein Dvina_04420 [Dactylosporangium vinaceum]|uniref:Glycosyltransferase RgtA/B/C/D-like domain-containing protein n=1 Tax=Dactylosporangium vinaceum TaxID=53362 RepID=A0ABV5MHW4_9ACTN|nr:hypothetical protein [Dactylosporangium vinaceum]UAB97429.1 hypothetical protein Dvina_04420 [Dactylosporangium vinaceum]